MSSTSPDQIADCIINLGISTARYMVFVISVGYCIHLTNMATDLQWEKEGNYILYFLHHDFFSVCKQPDEATKCLPSGKCFPGDPCNRVTLPVNHYRSVVLDVVFSEFSWCL